MKRKLEGFWKKAFYCVAAFFGAFYFYTAGFGLFSTESHRAMYLMLNVILSVILYKSSKNNKKVTILDIIIIVLAILSFGYWMLEYKHYVFRSGLPEPPDIIFGIIAILILLEVARRVLGKVLVIIAAVFMAQLYFGPYLPGTLAHQGFSIVRIIEFTYCTMEGVFGVITDTFATYVFPFILLGGIFEASGAGEFFIKLAGAATKGWVGGPAKMSVISSALFGSISGSSVANVVSTGTFTIPMMKKVGFKPEDAGAIEAAASTGGQFLPPVMGAGAFLLATLSETPYFKVAAMNVIPALLYFYWVGWSVHHISLKMNIKTDKDDDGPKAREVLKKGWFYFIPLILIVVILVYGYSPAYAAFYAIVSTVVLSWLNKETRVTPKKLLDGFASGAVSNLSVGATIGTLGMIMGGIVLAGLGSKFAALVVSLSGGSLFLTLLLINLVSILIGMGATQTATYIVVAMIAVPALTTLGINRVIAHIIAFWCSALSNVTPPVCVSAYAGAAIANADPMKTGIAGLKYCTMLLFVPFMFGYFPELLAYGSVFDIIYITILYIIGIPIATAALQRFWKRPLSVLEIILFFALGAALLIPKLILNIPAILIFTIYYFYRKKAEARKISESKSI